MSVFHFYWIFSYYTDRMFTVFCLAYFSFFQGCVILPVKPGEVRQGLWSQCMWCLFRHFSLIGCIFIVISHSYRLFFLIFGVNSAKPLFMYKAIMIPDLNINCSYRSLMLCFIWHWIVVLNCTLYFLLHGTKFFSVNIIDNHVTYLLFYV